MNVLISGGAGFLGKHLCKQLLKEKHKVTVIDNFCTSEEADFKQLGKKVDLRKMDVTELKFSDLEIDFDVVVHLASPASPVDYVRLPIETLLVGSLGTYRMLEAAKQNNARFLLASSSEIYGDPEVHPQIEEYVGCVNCIGPRAMYDESKRFGETLALNYHNVHSVDIGIMRIFNVYGPGMRLDDGRAIPNFISQALRGKPLTIYGNGEQTRSFCYVDDMIEAMMSLIEYSGCVPGPFNLGNPEEISIIKLAQMIIEMTGSKSKLSFYGSPPEDPRRRCPDISRAKRYLGWEPEVSLEDGLEETIKRFEGKLK